MMVCFDPGHGGKDSGAIGPSGLHEADVALEVAGMAGTMALADGWEFMLTRMRDSFVGLGPRAAFANQVRADVFVSIHCNAAANPNAHGFEVFTSPGQTRADRLATCVLDVWGMKFPDVPRRVDLTDGDGDKEKHLQVLMGTDMPGILVEMDFISHARIEAAMRTVAWRRAQARAIVDALNVWRGAR